MADRGGRGESWLDEQAGHVRGGGEQAVQVRGGGEQAVQVKGGGEQGQRVCEVARGCGLAGLVCRAYPQ